MKVNEIFKSIQGETSFAGLPFTFVRLTGCNLRCRYCDTTYAYEEGSEMSVDEIINVIKCTGIKRVLITGGEPLLQKDTPLLCKRLINEGFTVVIETNGSLPILDIDKRAHKILDLKCPGSGMCDHMNFQNITYINPQDEIKFVIGDRNDFDWAVDILQRYHLLGRCPVLFSPVYGKLQQSSLAEWIIAEKIDVRLQLQIQKYIWPDRDRGV